MHKPAQVELQLDWSQLPYPEYLGPLSQKVAQPNAQYKKGPYTLKAFDLNLMLSLKLPNIFVVG